MKILKNRIALGTFQDRQAYVELLEYSDASNYIFMQMLNAPYVDWATL